MAIRIEKCGYAYHVRYVYHDIRNVKNMHSMLYVIPVMLYVINYNMYSMIYVTHIYV